MVANLLQAPLLVILSVVDGLYQADPGASGLGEVIPLVTDLGEKTLSLAGDSRIALGTGGMRSKLEAARLVTRAGGSVVIASGRHDRPLSRILAGEPAGTLFLAEGRHHGARKRWIGLTARPRGHFVVDAGARKALESGTRSLLAIGILDVVGAFTRGDIVGIHDPDGHEFARGLTNYNHAEAVQIRGLRNEQVKQHLGTLYGEVIHKDNLVLI